MRRVYESRRLTIVDPTDALELLVKFTGGIEGMESARAAAGSRAALRVAYLQNFEDGRDVI
jgi:hypothetical protein